MKKIVYLTCLSVFVLGVAVMAFKLNKPELVSEEYVEYQVIETASGQRIHLKNPKHLDEVVSYANYIVTGEIVEAKNVLEEIELTEGSPEREVSVLTGQKTTLTRKGTNYLIKISEIIKGESSNKEITMYVEEESKNFRPELKVGEKFIFLLDWNEQISRYVDFHPTASYVKVLADGKIKPAYRSTTDFSSMEGQSYNKVKQKIKSLVQP